jgi:HK97 family phage major capsid protein
MTAVSDRQLIDSMYFQTLGQLLVSIHKQGHGPVKEYRLKSLQEQGASGGFLVPARFREEILARGADRAIVRPRGMVLPMEGASLQIPAAYPTDGSADDFAGLRIVWADESASLSDDTPVYGRIGLQAKKAVGLVRVSAELLADAGQGAEQYLTTSFGIAYARAENRVFLMGTGVGQPMGVGNCPALITVSKETGQAADTIMFENVSKMEARLLPSSFESAIWVCHPSVLPQLRTMTVQVGSGGAPVFTEAMTQSAVSTRALLGRPLLVTDLVPKLGDKLDIMLFDPSLYLIGDRQRMSVSLSLEAGFATDDVWFKITSRLDAQPLLPNAVTPETGSDSLSAYVTLAERA